MTAPLRAVAPAKLNLTLRVGRRRADGFHELESLVTQIDLADELTLTPDPNPVLAGAYYGHDFARDEVNLVARSANELLAHIGGFDALAARRGPADSAPGARFELHKHIPVGAGLGGGSSDAAAVLKLLNQHWRSNSRPTRWRRSAPASARTYRCFCTSRHASSVAAASASNRSLRRSRAFRC